MSFLSARLRAPHPMTLVHMPDRLNFLDRRSHRPGVWLSLIAVCLMVTTRVSLSREITL